MDVFFSLLPIAFLIGLMLRKQSVPSFIVLPAAAAVMYFFRLTYFETSSRLVHAGVLDGFFSAWTPILVIWGAVLLFRFLEETGAIQTLHDWISSIAENPVEQIMIIAWAFSFFVEGASGFGTPIALAAPILVGFGFPAARVLMLCLVMNSIPVSFGAVGTPTWFGLGNLGLSEPMISSIAQQTALIHFVASLFIPFLALRFLLSWKDIRKNAIFILLSVLSCTIPYLALSHLSSEFPSLIGGAIGLGLTILFSRANIGVARSKRKTKKIQISSRKLFQAFFPLAGIIVLLVLTRLEFLELKSLLTYDDLVAQLSLGEWGKIWLSPALVLGWQNILGTTSSWSHAILYVPSFLPFFLVVGLSFYFFSIKKSVQRKIWSQTYERMKKPILALVGILIFVKLLMIGEQSPGIILGHFLADITGHLWVLVSPLLGALGSFFSGSNTVSNLTFGGIQSSIAEDLGFPRSTILSLQNVGGAMGNMISIQNIVAGCSVLGLVRQEGKILLQTIKPLLWYAVIAGAMGIILI
ncbi:L-lactate permease [Candidatus Gracilibacteria bacterium]|nr:L-lactate permease [Candidatus Gracilibacteria bacterium]MCF7819602.1 L-lactate permease [Candidatus Gracilibacteria bacterium]